MADSPWKVAEATISSPRRGPGSQDTLSRIAVRSFSFTWSWGAQPAQGAIEYVANANWPAVTYGSWIEVNAYGKTFWGICQRGGVVVGGVGSPTESSSSGNVLRTEFLDPRTYLRWDQVFCAFNQVDIRLINGVRVRRYKHLLPENFRINVWTYTTGPVSAALIIDKILKFNTDNYPVFGTIGTIWNIGCIFPNGSTRESYHPDQIQNPVYNIDCLSGKYLDEVLQEIADAQGLLFTLQGGPFNLVFCRKGDGVLPTFPARSDNQEISQALSQNPTRMYVVGDRNRYLCLDLALSPDWNAKWESLLTVDGLMQDLYDNERDVTTGERYNAMTGDPEHASGYQLAAARAREISVREYAGLRATRVPSADWTDFRFFGGRCRMDMPAALYLDVILFRAFRPPEFVNIKGEQVPTQVLELVDDLFVKVFLANPLSPAMSYDLVNPPAGNGFAVAQGFNIGSELFKAIKPERFSLDLFTIATNLWQQVTFQIDDSFETGRYIILDEKFVNPVDLFVDPQALLNSADPSIASAGAELNGYQSVLKANPTISTPQIRAALCFEGDKFIFTYSSGSPDAINGSRDEKINESGLYQEVIQQANGVWDQLPYADGGTAESKSIQIASVLIRRPYWYYQGGFHWKLVDGDVIPDLSGMINRITVEYSASGHICDVQFANGRPEPVYRQEREYDRRRRWQSMLPGQQELRDQSRLLKQLAVAFRQSPRDVTRMEQFLRGRMGQLTESDLEPCVIANGAGYLLVGTPLWKKPVVTQQDGTKINTNAAQPEDSTTDHSVFVGVTTRADENAANKIWVQKSGLMLARVMGGSLQKTLGAPAPTEANPNPGPVTVYVEVGDSLVQSQGTDYLIKKQDGSTSAEVIGTARQRVVSAGVQLIQIMTPAGGGGGGGEGWDFEHQWVDKKYPLGAVVIRATPDEISNGAEAGTYRATGEVNPGDLPPGESEGVGAELAVVVIGGVVDSIEVNTAGQWYPLNAYVVIVGDGTGAKAHAVFGLDGAIDNIHVDNGGSGYAQAKTSAYMKSGLQHWEVVATGNWALLVVRQDKTKGRITLDAGRIGNLGPDHVYLKIEKELPDGSQSIVNLDLDTIPLTAGSKTITIHEDLFCTDVGDQKALWVRSEFYPPQ